MESLRRRELGEGFRIFPRIILRNLAANDVNSAGFTKELAKTDYLLLHSASQ